MAQTIADELKAIVTPEEKQLIEKIPTTNITAYDAYLKGQYYVRKLTPHDLDSARQYFELAKEKDPEFALPYAGIANIWSAYQQWGIKTPDEAVPQMMAATERALELDSSLADVHYIIAVMNTLGMWDWKGGESEFKKAIAINPNYADAHAMYSHLLNFIGRHEEAMQRIELALKLDPQNPLVKLCYCWDLLFVRRYEDCISASRELFETDSTMFLALCPLFEALHMKGRYEEAFEVVKLYFTNFYKDFDHAFNQYSKSGYANTLNLEGDTLWAQSKTKYIVPFDIADLYVFTGNKERALECLERAYELHDPNMPYIGRGTSDSLRDEPRFQAICRKMNIPCNN